MINFSDEQHKKLADFYNKIAETLAEEETPTKKSDSNCDKLEKLKYFTGYYSLVPEVKAEVKAKGISKGAFLSIDTFEIYGKKDSIVGKLLYIYITFSADGKTSKQYLFGTKSTFDGTNLVLKDNNGKDVLDLTFRRKYKDGILVECSGKIHGKSVTGSTRFNPVPLEEFAGDYEEVIYEPIFEKHKALSIVSEFEVYFDFGNESLKNILDDCKIYMYIPSMYVIIIGKSTDLKDAYVLYLGTANQMGLACRIMHNKSSRFAVTIPKEGNQIPTPKSSKGLCIK